MLKPITWTGQSVRLLDQTRLPGETVYVDITDEKQMHDAIRRLVVRGAPAIGIAAAFGVYLGVKDDLGRLNAVSEYLATSRPTAVNLFWAIEGIKRIGTSPQRILEECQAMLEEDDRVCRAIGEHGLAEISNLKSQISDSKSQISNLQSPISILTHCNAGGLATAGYGTALAPIYLGVERGRSFHVYVDETRPLLQGSRITAYELKANGVPVTLICDSMAAVVLGQKKIDACIVGADRIAANGDTANKIGTLAVAIAAKHFGVPFYVAAPTSTIDLKTASGADIPIEQRAASEVAHFASQATAPAGVDVFNPAFDVTPAELIRGIITENGVARPPFAQSLSRACGGYS